MRPHIAMDWLNIASLFQAAPVTSSQFSFTGVQRVKHAAGENLGLRCLFTFQGDATSMGVGLGDPSSSPATLREAPQSKDKSMIKRYLFLAMATCLLVDQASAHNGGQGALFAAEISSIEALITGGYMRIGLLAVSGAAAVMGILKQNGWMFVSGIAGCAFIYFMKNWITTTFAMTV